MHFIQDILTIGAWFSIVFLGAFVLGYFNEKE